MRFRQRIVVDYIRKRNLNRSRKPSRSQTIGRPRAAAVEAGIIF